jgi:hypothetical protein
VVSTFNKPILGWNHIFVNKENVPVIENGSHPLSISAVKSRNISRFNCNASENLQLVPVLVLEVPLLFQGYAIPFLIYYHEYSQILIPLSE